MNRRLWSAARPVVPRGIAGGHRTRGGLDTTRLHIFYSIVMIAIPLLIAWLLELNLWHRLSSFSPKIRWVPVGILIVLIYIPLVFNMIHSDQLAGEASTGVIHTVLLAVLRHLPDRNALVAAI